MGAHVDLAYFALQFRRPGFRVRNKFLVIIANIGPAAGCNGLVGLWMLLTARKFEWSSSQLFVASQLRRSPTLVASSLMRRASIVTLPTDVISRMLFSWCREAIPHLSSHREEVS